MYTTGRFDQRLGRPGAFWSGRLAQVHGRAALAFSDRGDGELTLLDPGRDLVPYGIQVPWNRLRPQVGDRVRLQAGRLSLLDGQGRARVVALAGGGVELSLLPDRAGCRMALRWQLARLDLPARTRALLDPTGTRPEGIAQAELWLLGRGLFGLVDCLLATDPDVERCVRALLGLGSGSTPSGDDLLLGALAAALRCRACGWLPPPGVGRMASLLAGLAEGVTTPVSRRMLAEGARGHFPEALLGLVQQLGMPGVCADRLAAPIGRLAALGRHSGADMLAGALGLARGILVRQPGPTDTRGGAR